MVRLDPLFFSIIIPSYRLPERLNDCLDSLVHLRYPSDRFEVIVVDDGSEIPPIDVVSSYQDRLNISLILQRHSGIGKVLNLGAEQARGKFLVFTCQDCRAKPDWLSALESHLSKVTTQAVGGQILNAFPKNLYTTTTHFLFDYLRPHFFTLHNLAVPKIQFLEMGGFDPSFEMSAGEDRDFCRRWRDRGYPMSYAPDAIVEHHHAMSFSEFWRKHWNYGQGTFRHRFLSARKDFRQISFEPLSFYWNLLKYPFFNGSHDRPWRSSILLFISQVANAAGFFWQGLKDFCMSKRLCRSPEVVT